MRSVLNIYIVTGLVLLISACTDTFMMPAYEAGSERGIKATCLGPPIMQNIIGTWQCGQRKTIQGDTLSKSVTLTGAAFSRLGTLTFDRNAYVIDPDSLFENRLDFWGPVLYKMFSMETDNNIYPGYGEMFWVRQFAKDTRGSVLWRQGYYFNVITNECNRIHLRGDTFEMVLVR